MKVAIIGANGFLGKNLVTECINKNWDVTCIYNKSWNNIPSNLNKISILQFLKTKDSFEIIFLVAAKIDQLSIEALIKSNFELPLKVAKKYKNTRIVFSSSVSAYGTHKSFISENSPFNNPNAYGISKIMGEFALGINTNHSIVRFSSIYGKGMNQSTFIPKIIDQAKKTGRITIFGDGSRLQDYIYIKDAVRILIETGVNKKTGIFLGVYGKSYSNLKMSKIVSRQLNNPRIIFKNRDINPSFKYDNSWTLETLKLKPDFSPEEGIKEML